MAVFRQGALSAWGVALPRGEVCSFPILSRICGPHQIWSVKSGATFSRRSGNAPAGFPLVGGQSAAYTIKQLTAYREGERTTDETYGGMMRGVASKLTDGEIAVLADYLQGLH